MINNSIPQIGRGPAFPFQRSTGGNWLMAEGYQIVNMSLSQLISTKYGTRPMKKKIGSLVNGLIFSLEGIPRDAAVKGLLERSLETWDSRIFIETAFVVDGENTGEVFVTVGYTIPGQKEVQKLVESIKREI